MVILSGWLQRLKKKSSITRSQIEETYVMEVPSALSNACMVMFLIGLVAFIGFSILFYRQIGDVTIGHLNFAMIFALIGLLGFISCLRWKIVVHGNEITLYNVFKGKKTIYVEQIDQAVRGAKGQLEIYVSGKKVKTIDSLATNFETFYDMLENNGIEVEYDDESRAVTMTERNGINRWRKRCSLWI